jgi:hypothetical protein
MPWCIGDYYNAILYPIGRSGDTRHSPALKRNFYISSLIKILWTSLLSVETSRGPIIMMFSVGPTLIDSTLMIGKNSFLISFKGDSL